MPTTDDRQFDLEARLSRLEERVFVNQKEQIATLAVELAALNKRLNFLIMILVGNLGFGMFKVIPALEKLL